MRWKLGVLLILLGIPASAFARGVWTELGVGPWLPMFGSFKSDHDPGFQGRVRVGYDGQFTVSQTLRTWFPPLSLFKDVYPFAEAYHSYNRLKGTGKPGNLIFFGVGGRVLNTAGSLAYGFQVSLGFLSAYTSGDYSTAGFLGVYGRWDLRTFYLYAEYSLETSVSLNSNYQVDTTLSFLQRSAGWHEVGVGVGFRFRR